MSILSKIGPEIFSLYRLFTASEQVHSFVGCPKYPQGQGFIAAIKSMFDGYVTVPEVLVIVTIPFSRGCLNDSFARRSNSGNSSRKIIPL